MSNLSTRSAQGLPADQIKGKMRLPADTDANLRIKDVVAQGKVAEVLAVQQAAADLQKQ